MTPTAALVGAGAVGTAVARRLAEKGVSITQVYSRTPAHARALTAHLPGCQALTDKDHLGPADVCWLTVPDDALGTLAAELAPLAHRHPRTLWVHCAGGVPLAALAPMGELTAVVYPLQSFTKDRPISWDDVPIWVEGATPHALQQATAWAHRLGPRVQAASSDERAWLHLGAVMAANFTNALMNAADALARHAGADWRVYLPLMQEVMAKLHQMPPHQAQTGPARRGDQGVTGRHLHLLGAHHPELVEAYRVMTELINRQQEAVA